MKRTVPLIITALVGVVLIVSNFIPSFRSWGEEATTFFSIIAAIAFVLGGGSRSCKVVGAPELLTSLPNVEVVDDLAKDTSEAAVE